MFDRIAPGPEPVDVTETVVEQIFDLIGRAYEACVQLSPVLGSDQVWEAGDTDQIAKTWLDSGVLGYVDNTVRGLGHWRGDKLKSKI